MRATMQAHLHIAYILLIPRDTGLNALNELNVNAIFHTKSIYRKP